MPVNATVSIEVSPEKLLRVSKTGSLMQESSYSSDGEVRSQTKPHGRLQWAGPSRKLKPQMEKKHTEP